MEKVTLTEGQLRSLIENTVREVINEAEMDEELWNNIKSGIKGAKSGFQAQRALDMDKTDYQRGGKLKGDEGVFGSGSISRQDAIGGKDGIAQMEKLAKEYASEGRRLWNKAQMLKKYYGVDDTEYQMNGKAQRGYKYNGQMGEIPDTSGMRRKISDNPTPQGSSWMMNKQQA